jgi:hypothetical protein
VVAALALIVAFFRSSDNILAGVALAAVIAVLVPLLAHLAASPRQVVIGADAVRLQRLTGPRLVPLATIERAAVDGTALVLHLHARPGEDLGERIRVGGSDAALAVGLVERIHGAMALSRRAASAVAAAQLEPEGRPFAEWRTALGALLRRGADYRHTALGAEDLLAVLEDAAAPPARRLGAAIALREGDHPEARARVRIAAEATADGDMRAALEAAAEEEMDEGPIRRVVEGR